MIGPLDLRRVGVLRRLVLVPLLAGSIFGCKLGLELDYAPATEPVLEHSSGQSLKDVFEDADIRLLTKPQALEQDPAFAGAVELSSDPAAACVDTRNFHQMIPAMKNRPFHPLYWYAHGVLLPHCCPGDVPPGCGGIRGAIWFENPGDEVREDFIVFNGYVNPQGVVVPHPADERMTTTLHELTHVLNLHHCEIGYQGDRLESNVKFGPLSLSHLVGHRKKYAAFIRPGKKGKRWCKISPPHQQMHVAQGCGYECSGLNALAAAQSPPGVRLILVPEKPRYQPGEPIRVTATLAVAPHLPPAARVEYLSEISLDPSLGYLRLWAGESAETLRPLGRMMIADAKLRPEPLDHDVSAAGLDVSAHLDPALIATAEPFVVAATFAGFDEPSRVVVSEPVTIRFADAVPPLFHPQASEIFQAEESRLFLLLLGGDHLQKARTDLETLAEEFPETVFAPYADLALGTSLALPFLGYDRGGEVLTVRPPDYAAAVAHLVRSEGREELLPPSYRLYLHQSAAIAFEGLGDLAAETDPQAAIEAYRQAERHRELLVTSGSLPRPISMTPAESKTSSERTLRRVQQKIAALQNG